MFFFKRIDRLLKSSPKEELSIEKHRMRQQDGA